MNKISLHFTKLAESRIRKLELKSAGYAIPDEEEDKEEKKRRNSKSAAGVASVTDYGSTKGPPSGSSSGGATGAGTSNQRTRSSNQIAITTALISTTTTTTTNSVSSGRTSQGRGLAQVVSASAALDQLSATIPPVTIVPGTGVRKSSSAGGSISLQGGPSPTRKSSLSATTGGQNELRRKSNADTANPRHSVISISSTVQPWQPGPGDKAMYDGPDMPSSDLNEDYMAPEPMPPPPDVSRLPRITNYEKVTFHSSGPSSLIPPPNAKKSASSITRNIRTTEQYASIPPLTDAEAREVLIKYVTRRCCYGKSAAQNMQIVKINANGALHYTLESFTESRSAVWVQEPYKGQSVDGPSNGPAPPPWSIPCHPSDFFQNEIHHIHVPHTTLLLPCQACGVQGCLRCNGCLGRGFKRCSRCNGSGRDWKTDAHGHRHVHHCPYCSSKGRKKCSLCFGDGRLSCRTCQGYRKTKCYIRLTVTFTCYLSEYTINRTEISDLLARNVRATVILEQMLPKVHPIQSHPDNDLCSASKRIVADHNAKFQHQKILMQRQRLSVIPVSLCLFTYRGKEGNFTVYGADNMVFSTDYPQKCCWTCVIL